MAPQASSSAPSAAPAQPAAPQPSAAALAADAQSRERAGAPGTHPEWDRLVRTIWRLRQPDGCPWDKKQTHDSISRNMVEEAYEAVDALEAHDPAHLREELGDVLMQVLLHAQIDADAGGFTIDDVCHELNEKLVRRHPHVFGELDAADADEVLQIWDQVKVGEARAQAQASPQVTHVLDGVPRAMPALMQCQKVSRKAAARGFEWATTQDVWDKVDEERAEFAAEERGSDAAELEFGDFLFAAVNVARKEGIDAEHALLRATDKFRQRWARMEDAAARLGETLDDMPQERMEELWAQAKTQE